MQTLPCACVCIIAFIRQTVCFNLPNPLNDNASAYLKSTERLTSKTPNNLPQKHRLICIKKQDFLADFINLLYLCWRIKKRFH